MAEQLVDEPVPSIDDFELVEVGEEEEEEKQPHTVPGSHVWDAEGHAWCRVVGPVGVYWWRIGTSIAQWTRQRGSPPGQGGTVVLAAATVADVAVVDVLVIMQHKFQQSLVLLQSSNRVVAFPVATQRQVCTALLC